MTLTIDKAGRVVLPKPVRDRLGLRPGAGLDLQVEADGELRLRSRRDEPALAVVEGVLIHRGQAPADFDWNTAVEAWRPRTTARVCGRCPWPATRAA